MPSMPSVRSTASCARSWRPSRLSCRFWKAKAPLPKNREVMGATDPAAAAEGTIRKEFALSKGENSVHGSDSEASAAREIAFFFSGLELVG